MKGGIFNFDDLIPKGFNNLYCHAKSLVKRKKLKILCTTSLKRLGHVESKIGDLEEILQIKLSCKI